MDLRFKPLDEAALKEHVQQNKRLLIGLTCIVLSGFCVLGYRYIHAEGLRQTNQQIVEAHDSELDQDQDHTDQQAQNKLTIYVTGAVEKPGLVEVEEGKRLGDAIDTCGGFTTEANTEALNLARLVKDGEQIHVPKQGDIQRDTRAPEANSAPTQGNAEPQRKININTASKEELIAIPGIGPGLAGKIIADRKQHGSFTSIDELERIKGLKGKKLDKIKDHICV